MKIHAGILPASTVRVAFDVLIALQSSSLISKLSMLLFAHHQAMPTCIHRFVSTEGTSYAAYRIKHSFS